MLAFFAGDLKRGNSSVLPRRRITLWPRLKWLIRPWTIGRLPDLMKDRISLTFCFISYYAETSLIGFIGEGDTSDLLGVPLAFSGETGPEAPGALGC